MTPRRKRRTTAIRRPAPSPRHASDGEGTFTDTGRHRKAEDGAKAA